MIRNGSAMPDNVSPRLTLTKSVLVISLSVHACCAVFMLVRAGLNYWASRKPRKWSSLATFHLRRDDILPNIVTQQFFTWTLIVMALVDVTFGEMIAFPFVPKVSRDLTLTQLVLCLNMGKYVYLLSYSVLNFQQRQQFRVNIFHHMITLCCYGVFYHYLENLFLCLIGVIVECDLVWSEGVHIYKETGCDVNNMFYKKLLYLSGFTTIFSRVFLPIAMLITSLTQQELMSMHFVSVIFWFLALVFFTALNIWMVASVLLRIRNTLTDDPLPTNITSDLERDHSDAISVPVDTSQIRPHHLPCPRPSSLPERSIALSFKNDLRYSNPLSNLNVNSQGEDSKINLTNKKLTPKVTVDNLSSLLKGSKFELTRFQLTDSLSGHSRSRSFSLGSERGHDNNAVSFETRIDETMNTGFRHVVIPQML